eukprot:CAMPEP_0196725066 /NCGR_PEP_ID=MMETSP1091-20130531/6727_1 /TAXON_ID=302021 /ORGANISM="Rhodomonas sp., Strain CCMP768" /LENGTH=239 /DNA_ID=CAMNT_0042067285 /DNA_START=20 /DNA_END=740 /DNA_ORIENTATION=-
MGLFSGLGWTGMIQLCRLSFPKAKVMSTAELDEALSDSGKSVLLLDARKAEEYEVSHLKEAVWVGEHGERPDLKSVIKTFQDSNAGKQQIIACYCSVGYRSGRLVAKLSTEQECSNVFNVEGSLFRWANEGRAVWCGESQLEKATVHPYSHFWSALLDEDKRSELPYTTPLSQPDHAHRAVCASGISALSSRNVRATVLPVLAGEVADVDCRELRWRGACPVRIRFLRRFQPQVRGNQT